MSHLLVLKAFLFPGTESLFSFAERSEMEMDQESEVDGERREGVAATAGRN